MCKEVSRNYDLIEVKQSITMSFHTFVKCDTLLRNISIDLYSRNKFNGKAFRFLFAVTFIWVLGLWRLKIDLEVAYKLNYNSETKRYIDKKITWASDHCFCGSNKIYWKQK